MIKQLTGTEEIYKLALADGTVWGLSATKSILPWLKELAKITRLEKASIDEINKRIFFLALNKENQAPTRCDDWKTVKQGTVYRAWSHSTIQEIFIELNPDFIDHPEIKIINMWSSLKAIYSYYVDQGTGPAHAAMAEHNGKGILIAAAGGIGKSTCYERLPNPWRPLADDLALIVKDVNDEFHIHPMPTWSDHLWSYQFSTFNSAYSVKLNAIFFLEQSDKDAVIPIRKSIAIQKIFACFKQVWENYFDKLDKKSKTDMRCKIFNSACDIAEHIPCYTLQASIEGKFWEEIEKVI